MAGVREFFQTPAGKGVAGVFVAVAVCAAGYVLLHGNGSAEIDALNTRYFVDAENGKSFSANLEKATVPMTSPFSGKKTAWPAELCYWTKDGKPKTDPTPVLLNEYKGKQEPTFCPDCGRLVVGHNPQPSPNGRPPPTQAEYASSGR